MKPMKMEDRLALDRFRTDDLHAHIDVDRRSPDADALRRVSLACPAQCYTLNADGSVTYSHLGCLECGACRVLSAGTVVKSWSYPRGGLGVSYREG